MVVIFAEIVRTPPTTWLSQLCARHATLFPAMENGVDTGQILHPLLPSIEVPVYPEVHTVQAEESLPMVLVLFVLYPIPQAMHPDVGTLPSLEYLPCGHILHTEASLPCVPESVDLPVGQTEQPLVDEAELVLLYVPGGHAIHSVYPNREYLPAIVQSKHVALDVAPVALYMIIHTESRYTQTYNRVSRYFRDRWIQS